MSDVVIVSQGCLRGATEKGNGQWVEGIASGNRAMGVMDAVGQSDNE